MTVETAIAIAGLTLALLAIAIRLERRLSTLEADVRWLISKLAPRPEDRHE